MKARLPGLPNVEALLAEADISEHTDIVASLPKLFEQLRDAKRSR